MQSFLVSFWLRKSSDVPDLLYQKHHSSLCPANAFPVGLSPVLSAQKFSAGHMGDFPPPLPLLFWFPSNNSVYNHKLSNSAICVSSKVWVWIGVFSLGLWTPCSRVTFMIKESWGPLAAPLWFTAEWKAVGTAMWSVCCVPLIAASSVQPFQKEVMLICLFFRSRKWSFLLFFFLTSSMIAYSDACFLDLFWQFDKWVEVSPNWGIQIL